MAAPIHRLIPGKGYIMALSTKPGNIISMVIGKENKHIYFTISGHCRCRCYNQCVKCSHGSPVMKFPDFFQTFPDQLPILLTFAAREYDILTDAGIRMDHTEAIFCSDHLVKKLIWRQAMI